MKCTILKEVDEEVHARILKETDRAIKDSQNDFKKIFETINSLKPHSKIYFINELIAQACIVSKLPPFVITAILDGLIRTFQLNPQLRKEIIEPSKYIG